MPANMRVTPAASRLGLGALLLVGIFAWAPALYPGYWQTLRGFVPIFNVGQPAAIDAIGTAPDLWRGAGSATNLLTQPWVILGLDQTAAVRFAFVLAFLIGGCAMYAWLRPLLGDLAAGLAGLIKAAKAVHHGVLPPTCNIAEPNPYYDPDVSPFRFIDRPQPWPDEVRRAGISAVGFGGTNFHTVISSAPGADPAVHGLDEWPAELFVVRAETTDAALSRLADLQATVDKVVAADPAGQRHHLRDLAAAVCTAGRGPVQVAFVADDLAHLASQLRVAAAGATMPICCVASFSMRWGARSVSISSRRWRLISASVARGLVTHMRRSVLPRSSVVLSAA